MKKTGLIIVLAMLLGSAVALFNGNMVKAAERTSLSSGYYFVKPKLDKNLQVGYDFKLRKKNPDLGLGKFEFYYLPSKKAYVIHDQFGLKSAGWNGQQGVGNLALKDLDQNDEKMLWTLEKESDNKYVIHNKKDPTMVWGVHNYYPVLGAPIKLEKVHSVVEPQFNAQVFTLEG